jgi:peptidoglycan hydrolase-like protein with peptidoglycan-binding domain
MTDVQVTLSLPVLKVGSSPESGPTVIKHLQLMLNQRGGSPVLIQDGEFGSSTGASVEHYQQNENLTVDGVVGRQTC